jgi:4'-phosphopantetheinyl transferase
MRVDVWSVRLDDEAVAAAGEAVLDDPERTRAARFAFDRDRQRFVRRRVALRSILARYARMPPAQLQFVSGSHGKPTLAGPSGRTVAFSASHANELAVVAVTDGATIGIDLEWTGRTVEWHAISSMFAVGERAQLLALSGAALERAGFRCWTRKEAYVKARGDGLSLPLELFEVTVTEGEPARVAHVAAEIDDGVAWTLTEIDVGPGYVACLATADGAPSIERYDANAALGAS